MAEANISVSQDQFSCSICLDLLKDPATIPCGHSYCMKCVTRHWNQQEDYSTALNCPLCKRTFTPRPALHKNVVFSEMVEKLRNTQIQTADPDLSYAEPGDVKCDVCVGRKRKAVKSCLLCLESYCQTHFEHHEKFHSGRRHKLTDATARLKQMICSKHDKQLEIFCRTDQSCICYLCTMDEHRDHDTVAAVVERMEKQSVVEEMQKKVQQRIQEKENELREMKEFAKNYKISSQAAVEDSERIFTELIRFIERSRSEVLQKICGEERVVLSETGRILAGLEEKIEYLRRNETALEQLRHTDDHVHFIQGIQSFKSPLEYTDGCTKIRSDRTLDDVGQLLSDLKEQLEGLCKEHVKKISSGVSSYLEVTFCTASLRPFGCPFERPKL